MTPEPTELDGLSLENFSDPDPVTPPEPPAPEPVQIPDAEPPADGLVEVQGQKINIGPIVAAERRRAEARAEARVRAELAQRDNADVSQMRAELQALKAQLQPQAPAAPEVSDTDAETYARRHQLFGADGTLEIKTAKSILAEQRAESRRIRDEAAAAATEAAKQALAPVQKQEASRAAMDNFNRIAATKDVNGDFVFKDPATHPILLAEWNALPDELRAVPEVAEVIVDRALGRIARTTKRGPAPVVEREPALSESVTNHGGPAYTMSAFEKKHATEAGMDHKDFEARAKTYQPGRPNSLE